MDSCAAGGENTAGRAIVNRTDIAAGIEADTRDPRLINDRYKLGAARPTARFMKSR